MAYGVNLLPAERVAEEVMRLNAKLAQQVRETGATFTLDELDRRFQSLLLKLEESGVCHRGEPLPPIIAKEQRPQARWTAIQSLARGEKR